MSITLPSGMLTIFFSDIEGSTPRWENAPSEMRRAMAHHDAVLDEVISAQGGVIFKHTGDGVGAVFTSPERAAEAALECQRQMQSDGWDGVERLKIRIGLHMGDCEPVRNDYFGPPVNRAARVMDIANGDQIAISGIVAGFLRNFDVHDMGEHQLKGIGTEHISLLQGDGLLADDRPLRSRVRSTSKPLPHQPHRLIGRDRELEEIAALLEAHRSVTMVGPGGVGKTRLSIDVGTRVSDQFPDGVAFCDLVPIADGAAVVDAVAEAVGARSQPGMTLAESIVNFLEDRKMLLIFDNCEHVASDVQALGHHILQTDGCRILATSREPIGLPAEQLYGVSPLDTAGAAVDLFVERAAERDHAFSPSAADLTVIAEICQRLDGVPLGIELAAAWVRMLSPAELLERLDDRFQVLRGGRSGGRHQTLRDTVLWSYEQLDEVQARLFDRLSVFAGGFSLDAVEAVCADDDLVHPSDVLDVLMALVDKSMVVSQRGVGHIRFGMLGTLRQFGQEQLDAGSESALFRKRHGHYFREFAIVQSALLISDKEAEVWELLDREWANLRAAFDSMLVVGEFEAAAEMLLPLGWFASMSMRFEAFVWVDDLATATDIMALPDAGSLWGMRALGAYFTVHPEALTLAEQGLAVDASDRFGYCRLAISAISLNNLHSAEVSDALTSAWLEHLTDDSPLASRMWAEGMRAFHLCSFGQMADAALPAQRLAALAARTDSATAHGVAHWAGGLVSAADDIGASSQQWKKGIDSARSLHAVHLVYHLIVGLILHFSAGRGEVKEVVAGCLDALEQANDQHYLAGTSHLFGVTAIALCRTGREGAGAQLLGAMEANGHFPRPNAIRAVDRALGEAAVAAKRPGRELSINEAAQMAMNELRAAAEDVA